MWLAGWRNVDPAIALRRFIVRRLTFVSLCELLDTEQDRWILWVPVFAGVGIGLYFALPFEPGLVLVAAPLLAAIAFRVSLRRGVLTLALTGALLSTALGFAAAKLRAEVMRGPVIGFSKQIWSVHGWVELVEKRPGKGVRVTLRVSAIEGLAESELPVRVRVHTPYDNTGLHAGDPIVIKSMLQPPPQPAEPDGYDFARASWFAGVGGVGFAIGRPQADMAPPAMPWWTIVKTSVERMRETVSDRIAGTLPGPVGAITDALVTGEHEAIPQAMTDVLRDSGLAHILAISGLKLTIMAGALFGLTRLLLAAIPAIALRWPVKKIASGAGLAGATFYLLISGCGSATTRAYVMIAISLIAMLLNRPGLSMRNLAVAALCLILPQPETILDPSFQMSFSAVVALMATYEWAREWREPDENAAYHRRVKRRRLTGWQSWFAWGAGRFSHVMRETIAATTIATIAIAPYTVFTFHRVAVYGMLANIVAVPLFNVVIMPLVALALAAMPFGLDGVPLLLVARWVDVLMWIAERVSALPGAVILVPQMPVSALAVMTLGGIWLCVWRRGWRYLGLAAIAAGIAMAARGEAADILIGAEGRPIAVRLADGTLSSLAARSGSFELAQWLQADADGRDAKSIQTGTGFRCDGLGCTALVRGAVVAISDSPASLRDDCAGATIVILRYRQPAPCAGPALVIDIRDLRVGGAHAIRMTKSGPVLSSVAISRGDRPWSATAKLYDRSSQLEEMATAGWQRYAAIPGRVHKSRRAAKPRYGPGGGADSRGTVLASLAAKASGFVPAPAFEAKQKRYARKAKSTRPGVGHPARHKPARHRTKAQPVPKHALVMAVSAPEVGAQLAYRPEASSRKHPDASPNRSHKRKQHPPPATKAAVIAIPAQASLTADPRKLAPKVLGDVPDLAGRQAAGRHAAEPVSPATLPLLPLIGADWPPGSSTGREATATLEIPPGAVGRDRASFALPPARPFPRPFRPSRWPLTEALLRLGDREPSSGGRLTVAGD